MILGMDFFWDAEVVVEVRAGTITLFSGVSTVPKTTIGEYPVAVTMAMVVVPPFFELLSRKKTKANIEVDFMIE